MKSGISGGYIETIWTFLSENGDTGITYQQLSQHLRVGSDTAKKCMKSFTVYSNSKNRMLYAFSEEKSDEVDVTYMMSGISNKDNKHEFLFTTKRRLEGIR